MCSGAVAPGGELSQSLTKTTLVPPAKLRGCHVNENQEVINALAATNKMKGEPAVGFSLCIPSPL